MLVLAIDTALGASSAAVLDSDAGRVLAQRSVPMARGHAEALMPIVANVMAESGIGFADLDRVAATTGPGSFTGLRVGLSAARGIGLAAGKPVIGVTTLNAYAAPYISEDSRNPVVAAIDARHDQVYVQIVSGNGSSLVRPKLAPIQTVLEAARFGPPVIVGNAAELLAARWSIEIPPTQINPLPAPDIQWVAWLGAAVNPATAPARPYYLRAPDAKPQAARLAQTVP